MQKLRNDEDIINFSRYVRFAMAIFSAHDFNLGSSDIDRTDMSLGKGIDMNPCYKMGKNANGKL